MSVRLLRVCSSSKCSTTSQCGSCSTDTWRWPRHSHHCANDISQHQMPGAPWAAARGTPLPPPHHPAAPPARCLHTNNASMYGMWDTVGRKRDPKAAAAAATAAPVPAAAAASCCMHIRWGSSTGSPSSTNNHCSQPMCMCPHPSCQHQACAAHAALDLQHHCTPGSDTQPHS